MSQGFFHRNQKLMMTVLLVVIAPSFAFTGLMTSVMQGRLSGNAFQVFGETMTVSEFLQAKKEYRKVMRAAVARGFGNTRRIPSGDEVVLRHYIMMREADRLGVVLSDEELAENIREVAKDLICGLETIKKLQTMSVPEGFFVQYFQIFFQQARLTARFTKAAYLEALNSPSLGLGMTVKEFEDNIAVSLRLQKLQIEVADAVVVSERESYEEFDEQNHERVLQFVRVPAESFNKAAKKQTTDEDLERIYDANPSLFALPNRLSFDALKINFLQLTLSHQPSAEAVSERYENDKASLYLKKSEFETEATSDEEEYKPLEEVQAEIITAIRNEWALEKQESLLDAALAEGKKLVAEGATINNLRELVDAEYREHVDVIRSPVFSTADVGDLPANILNAPRLRSLLRRCFPVVTPGNTAGNTGVESGDFGDDVVELPDGYYIYRVAERHEQGTPDLADCRDEVMEKAIEEKSGELVLEQLQGWYDEITAEDSTATLVSKAQESNYTVTTCDAAGRNSSDKIAIDGEPLLSAISILNAGFLIEAADGMSEPILARDGTEAYLVQLVEIVPANSAKYAALRDQMRRQVRGRKAQVAWQTYMTDLERRAAIQRLFEVVEEEGEGADSEGDGDGEKDGEGTPAS